MLSPVLSVLDSKALVFSPISWLLFNIWTLQLQDQQVLVPYKHCTQTRLLATILSVVIMQDLCNLPSNLQQLVMANCSAPLLLKLHLLPEPLQGAALHAAFPSITASSSLTAPALKLDHKYVTSFWKAAGRQTGLEHLQCTSDVHHSDFVSTALLCHLSTLTNLKCLSFRGFGYLDIESQDSARTLALSLALLSHLLHMPGMALSDSSIRILAPIISKMQRLRALDLSQNPFGDSGVSELSPLLSQPPELHTLNIKRCDIGEKGS